MGREEDGGRRQCGEREGIVKKGKNDG